MWELIQLFLLEALNSCDNDVAFLFFLLHMQDSSSSEDSADDSSSEAKKKKHKEWDIFIINIM